MKAKILFLDDIFSDLFRKQIPSDQLVWDDNWVSAVTDAILESNQNTDVVFNVIKSGEIEAWDDLVKKEKPDIILLDLFWPEQAVVKYNDRRRGTDISLDILFKIRKAYPDLPVVCYTVKPEKSLLDQAYQNGATFFLEKVTLAMPEIHSPLRYIFIYLLRQAENKK